MFSPLSLANVNHFAWCEWKKKIISQFAVGYRIKAYALTHKTDTYILKINSFYNYIYINVYTQLYSSNGRDILLNLF